ncbi:MAG: hypothetical protein ACYTG6_15540 [Planctomycetota bacterium]
MRPRPESPIRRTVCLLLATLLTLPGCCTVGVSAGMGDLQSPAMGLEDVERVLEALDPPIARPSIYAFEDGRTPDLDGLGGELGRSAK